MTQATGAALIAALISLFLSAMTALFSYLSTVRSHDRISALQERLHEARSERDALRDYQYEARKRLYTDLQPLVFDLAERSEVAQRRILEEIVGGARAGLIGQPGRLGIGWRDDSYHMVTTLWELLTPLALIRMERQRLTGLDLSVDPHLRWQYHLARELQHTWTAGTELGRQEPVVAHDDDEAETRQYFLSGALELITSSLIRNTGNEPELTSYVAFREAALGERQRELGLDRAVLMFTDFHPATKPVLWRLLVAATHIHACLTETFNTQLDSVPGRPIHPVDTKATSDWTVFDWRSPTDTATADEVKADVEAARAFLLRRIPRAQTASQ